MLGCEPQGAAGDVGVDAVVPGVSPPALARGTGESKSEIALGPMMSAALAHVASAVLGSGDAAMPFEVASPPPRRQSFPGRTSGHCGRLGAPMSSAAARSLRDAGRPVPQPPLLLEPAHLFCRFARGPRLAMSRQVQEKSRAPVGNVDRRPGVCRCCRFSFSICVRMASSLSPSGPEFVADVVGVVGVALLCSVQSVGASDHLHRSSRPLDEDRRDDF